MITLDVCLLGQDTPKRLFCDVRSIEGERRLISVVENWLEVNHMKFGITSYDMITEFDSITLVVDSKHLTGYVIDKLFERINDYLLKQILAKLI